MVQTLAAPLLPAQEERLVLGGNILRPLSA